MVEIVRSSYDDGLRVVAFMEPVCRVAYSNTKYDIKPEYYSLDVLSAPKQLDGISRGLENRVDQLALLALDDGEIVGTVSLRRADDFYFLQNFYVALDRQGTGLGSQLLREVLAFYDQTLPIRLNTAETNEQAISIYRQWGFVERRDLGVRVSRWDEWPAGVSNGYIYMDLSTEGAGRLKRKRNLESKV